MDVLKPEIVWIEGRCYRFFERDAWSAKDHSLTPYTEESNPQEFSELAEECSPTDIEITSIEGGKYKHSFYVPSIFFGFIIGANGAGRKKLEKDTGTTIRIPRIGRDGDIVIIGSRKTGVLSARHRIDLIVESSEKKLKPTHFIAIPMNNKIIAENYEKFKNIVLNETGKNSEGVQEGIFQKAEKMHLTIGMMVLFNDEKIKAAIQALEECKEKIIKPMIEKSGTIKVKAQGLDCMTDDPSRTTVAYANISSDDETLQQLANQVMNFFIEKGLMRKQYEKVKLHLTVMNSSFLLDFTKQIRYQEYEKFDATEILKAHVDFYFGEIPLNEIQLCARGEKAEDGYYKIVSRINVME